MKRYFRVRRNTKRRNPAFKHRGIAKVHTRETRDPGGIHIKYHDTEIVTVHPDGRVTLRSGGWLTATTKKRMNQAADAFALNFSVYQRKHDWYVVTGDKTIPFEDGMTFTPLKQNPAGRVKTEHGYYWVQVQAPAGNWVDSLGTEVMADAIRHMQWEKDRGRKARVITRRDTVVLANPAKGQYGPRIRKAARQMVRKYGKRRARAVAGGMIGVSKSRRMKEHFVKVRRAINPRRKQKTPLITGWRPFIVQGKRTSSDKWAKWEQYSSFDAAKQAAQRLGSLGFIARVVRFK